MCRIFAVLEIIFHIVRKSETFVGGVIVISTMGHTQLQPVSGSPFLILYNIITCYTIVKLETCVRSFGDMRFQLFQQIIQISQNSFTNDILDKIWQVLNNVPSYVDAYENPLITSDTYRLYGRKSPANKATTSFVHLTKTKYNAEDLKKNSKRFANNMMLSW